MVDNNKLLNGLQGADFSAQNINQRLISNTGLINNTNAYIQSSAAYKQKCNVCWTSHDPARIITCSSCRLTVHPYCYGVTKYPFVCYLCKFVSANDPRRSQIRCALCLRTGGALKCGNENIWVHVHCVLLNTNGIVFEHLALRMYPQNIRAALLYHRKSGFKCSICNSIDGLTSSCSVANCDKRMHGSCAIVANLYFFLYPVVNGVNNVSPNLNSSRYNGVVLFCNKHTYAVRNQKMNYPPNSQLSPSVDSIPNVMPMTVSNIQSDKMSEISNWSNGVPSTYTSASNQHNNSYFPDVKQNSHLNQYAPLPNDTALPQSYKVLQMNNHGPSVSSISHNLVNTAVLNNQMPHVAVSPNASVNNVPNINNNLVQNRTTIPNRTGIPQSNQQLSQSNYDEMVQNNSMKYWNQYLTPKNKFSYVDNNTTSQWKYPSKINSGNASNQYRERDAAEYYTAQNTTNLAQSYGPYYSSSGNLSNPMKVPLSYNLSPSQLITWKNEDLSRHPSLHQEKRSASFIYDNAATDRRVNNNTHIKTNMMKAYMNMQPRINMKNCLPLSSLKDLRSMKFGNYEKLSMFSKDDKNASSILPKPSMTKKCKDELKKSTKNTTRYKNQISRVARPKGSEELLRSSTVCTRGQKFNWQKLDAYFYDIPESTMTSLFSAFDRTFESSFSSLFFFSWVLDDLTFLLKLYHKRITKLFGPGLKWILVKLKPSTEAYSNSTNHKYESVYAYLVYFSGEKIVSTLPFTKKRFEQLSTIDLSQDLNNSSEAKYTAYMELFDRACGEKQFDILTFCDLFSRNQSLVVWNDVHKIEKIICTSIVDATAKNQSASMQNFAFGPYEECHKLGIPKASNVFQFFILLKKTAK